MITALDAAVLAPLDYIVMAIGDCADVPAEAVRELLALESAEIVRLVDVLVVQRRGDGIDEIETSALPASHPLAAFAGRTHDVLTHDDLCELTKDVPPAACALVIVLEHCWATELEHEMRRAGAAVTRRGPIRRDALIASLQMAERPVGLAPRHRRRPRVTGPPPRRSV